MRYLAVLVLLLLSACAKPWMVTTTDGGSVPVKGAGLSGKLVIHSVGSERVVDLGEVQILELDQERKLVRDGDVYYGIAIRFLEGPPLGADTARPAYAPADLFLEADAPGGYVRIPFTDLQSLTRMESDAYEKVMADTAGKGSK